MAASVDTYFAIEQRSRLCAILAERTGEIPGQFISKKTAAEDKESKDQLKEIDNAMKKVEDSQDITMDNLSAEQLWNIRWVLVGATSLQTCNSFFLLQQREE